ncbi:Glycosyl transferase family 2 [Lacunisphaera limnophila]|uniref:Glycosyl transferase family 2 n=1 Tax=Lacunisphaera limnophila TaxID=1838286 RepID=A0A1D8AXV6_9BACT|nr:glycosyltransferase family 2 protein [Lacunisphaera limnophila]AOS45729.1 Glycosyl transferase family 2 [Lacunisphaera limnophila]
MADHAPLSVLIPAKNEAANLAACLASVAWCDDVVVVDSGSTDGTPEIARAAGARVVDFKWDGHFPKKKNWALANVAWKNEWVFIIDADERVTPPLEQAMRAALAGPHSGWYVNRRFWFLDGWLNHCGYFPSWNLRLFRHRLGRYEQPEGAAATGSGDNEVHEHVELQGSAGYLAGEMEHHAFPDIATWVEKHNRYSSWEARMQTQGNAADAAGLDPALARKRRLRRLAWGLPFRPTLRFLYHYVVRAGFLDGYRGFVFCRLMGWYEFLNATKAAELRRKS